MRLIKLITAFCLVINISNAAISEEEKIVEMGMAASSLLRSTLTGKMKKELKKENKDLMVDFCANQAQDITKGVNNLLPEGVSVKRIALKNRNELNRVDKIDIPHIKELEKRAEKSKKPESLYKLLETKEGYVMYRPISVRKKCLTCHGDKSKMNSVIKAKIEKKYPDDQAFGFNVGDFRGVFKIEINKKAYR